MLFQNSITLIKRKLLYVWEPVVGYLSKTHNLFGKCSTIFFLLFISILPLRLVNLPYSDFIYDEAIPLSYLKESASPYTKDYIISQHKGPGQYFIAWVTYYLSGGGFSEYMYRFPFSLANCLSIPFYFLFVFRFTRDKKVALLASYLMGVNGFIVGLGRIFQYQSFNLLFSIISLYFYSKIGFLNSEKINIKNSIFGTLFFSLSLLFHWDALFILPYALYVVVRYIFCNKKIDTKFKILILVLNLLVLAFIVGPYLFNYYNHFHSSSYDQQYLNSRVSNAVPSASSIVRQISTIFYKIRFYNPLFLVPLIFLSLGILVIRNIKSYALTFSWFIIEFLFFTLIFTNTGTHIYNMFIPLNILVGAGLVELYRYVKNFGHRFSRFKNILKVLIAGILMLLYIQSYIIFVDHNNEYPQKDKKLIFFNLKGIEEKDRKFYRNFYYNNKIGFPYRRDWNYIAGVMDKFELAIGANYRSIPIETNDISYPIEFYTGRDISNDGERFILAVKYPMSLVNDYKNFSSSKDKDLVASIKNFNGDTVAIIYFTKGIK